MKQFSFYQSNSIERRESIDGKLTQIHNTRQNSVGVVIDIHLLSWVTLYLKKNASFTCFLMSHCPFMYRISMKC